MKQRDPSGSLPSLCFTTWRELPPSQWSHGNRVHGKSIPRARMTDDQDSIELNWLAEIRLKSVFNHISLQPVCSKTARKWSLWGREKFPILRHRHRVIIDEQLHSFDASLERPHWPLHCHSQYNFRAERCTDAPANSTHSGPVLHPLSMYFVLMKILSHTSAKKTTERLKGFKFGYFQVISWQWRG